MDFNDEDFLQLSGLQHFKFCRRQWALIHIENQWAENYRTTDGAILHENAHNGAFSESRGDLLVTRDMRIFSRSLGVSGACDVLEFHRGETGIPLKGREGLWQPYPVEYKRGKPKEGTEDALQLCGQAMCLEEMLCCEIPRGALYYGEPRRRTEVDFTPELRREVTALLSEMHDLYRRGHTPKVKPTKACSACSLKSLCLPKLMRGKSVSSYLRGAMEGLRSARHGENSLRAFPGRCREMFFCGGCSTAWQMTHRKAAESPGIWFSARSSMPAGAWSAHAATMSSALTMCAFPLYPRSFRGFCRKLRRKHRRTVCVDWKASVQRHISACWTT